MDMFEKYLKYKKKYMESTKPEPFHKQFLRELITNYRKSDLTEYVAKNKIQAINSYVSESVNQNIMNFFDSLEDNTYDKVKTNAVWIINYINNGTLPQIEEK